MHLDVAGARLEGELSLPLGTSGIVAFAHGSGSTRRTPRNRQVARVLRDAGLGTLLLDLLTEEEERLDELHAHLRYDIDLLAARVIGAVDWLVRGPATKGLSIGIFGASTGAAAALEAAAERPAAVRCVVSRGGRPDMAGGSLARVKAPTLLLVGSEDHPVTFLNRSALARLGSTEKQLALIPGATHLFEEPGTLEEAARLSAAFFCRHLGRAEPMARRLRA